MMDIHEMRRFVRERPELHQATLRVGTALFVKFMGEMEAIQRFCSRDVDKPNVYLFPFNAECLPSGEKGTLLVCDDSIAPTEFTPA